MAKIYRIGSQEAARKLPAVTRRVQKENDVVWFGYRDSGDRAVLISTFRARELGLSPPPEVRS